MDSTLSVRAAAWGRSTRSPLANTMKPHIVIRNGVVEYHFARGTIAGLPLYVTYRAASVRELQQHVRDGTMYRVLGLA